MSLFSNTAVLLSKELRTEFRSRELLTTTVVFILVVLILFSFAISPTTGESREFGPGLLWLAILFAASLMLQPCFLREQSNDTLSSLRLAVSDSFSIFLAKLIANTLFLLLTELIMLPFFALFYNLPILPELHWLILVLFLGSLGISVTGTALSAISAEARMRELLLPLLLLPLLTPVLVVSATVTVSLFEREPIVKGKGIAFLAVFDVIFLTALWLFGEYLLEE
jgi:heme exporter protein B